MFLMHGFRLRLVESSWRGKQTLAASLTTKARMVKMGEVSSIPLNRAKLMKMLQDGGP